MMYEWKCHDADRECWSFETPVGGLYFDRATWLDPMPRSRWRCLDLEGGQEFLPGETSADEVKQVMMRDAAAALAAASRKVRAACGRLPTGRPTG